MNVNMHRKPVGREVTPVLRDLAAKYPVVTITGPRQSGKTTLARYVFPEKKYANLEMPDVRSYAREDPRGFLDQFRDVGGIIDEIQRVPELTSYIQGLTDETDRAGQFILTGSQQFEMMSSVTQSLAGRTALIKLPPFSFSEATILAPDDDVDRMIYRGFYPRILDKKLNPTQALADYTATYLERDVRQLSRIQNIPAFETFIRLCAGRVGQVLNYKSLGDDAGISHATAKEWIGLLEASYVVYRLRPFHANLNKRLIKSPKLYFLDVGLAAYLLGIENETHVKTHPARGFLFENLVIMEALKGRWNSVLPDNLFFYRDSNGNEVDLLWTMANHVLPIEIKAGKTVSGDYFAGLRAFSRAFAPKQATKGLVVYCGNETQSRRDASVTPFLDFRKCVNKWMERNRKDEAGSIT